MAELGQIDRQRDVPLDPQRPGYPAARLQLEAMPLAIVARQRIE